MTVKKKAAAGDVGDDIASGNANWSFGGKVADTFDDHVSKSVPLYDVTHDLGLKIADFFLGRGALHYDAGCSTGRFLELLAERNREKGVRHVGIDIEPGMAERAAARCARFPLVEIRAGDVFDVEFEPASFVTAYYTVQFIQPQRRQDFFDKVYRALSWGGGFLFFEKVRAPDARFQDMMTQIYHDYKLERGYTPEQVMSKARSLKGVLEPFSTQGNVDLARRAGFVDVMTVYKYVSFEGFLAIK